MTPAEGAGAILEKEKIRDDVKPGSKFSEINHYHDKTIDSRKLKELTQFKPTRFLFPDSLERFMDSILKQKVLDNIGQDQAAEAQQPGYTQNVNGPWYQNGWEFNKVNMQPYGQTPPGWKRG